MSEAEETIWSEFSSISEHLKKWGETVDHLLVIEVLKRLDDNHLLKILPQSRLKEKKSYISKALYRGKKYDNPILDTEDKVGTRVVVLTSDTVNEAKELVLGYQGWNAKLTKDINQEIEDKPKSFDYQSCHIVVWPKPEAGYPNDILAFLTCEIQIRTLLQHAFAEVSHDSVYKGPYKNDKEMLRKLAKAMALMEATDDYFCTVFTMMRDEERMYKKYLDELIRTYTQFQPSFEKTNVDIELTEIIFNLWENERIEISELEEFCVKYKEDISKIVAIPSHLCQQPVILLIQYYFVRRQTFLKENWPLSDNLLENIFYWNNTSIED